METNRRYGSPAWQSRLTRGPSGANVGNLIATGDGSVAYLYVDGRDVASGAIPKTELASSVVIGAGSSSFVAGFTVYKGVLTPGQIADATSTVPNAELIAFDTPSHDWPVQTRGQAGYRSPQNPATLPHSAASPSTPVAKPITDPVAVLTPRDPNSWAILGSWNLAVVTDVPGGGEDISAPDFKGGHWLHATVPGTVLTTYIDRGIYPDSDYGLNNLAIPEKLSRQQYW